MAIHTTQGYKLQVNNGSAQVNVNGTESMTLGGASSEEYDVTSLYDTTKQKLTGFADPGTFSAAIFQDFDDAGQAFLRAEAANSNTVKLLIVLPVATAGANNIAFNVACKDWSHDFARGPAKATFSGAISGAVTVTN